jgi:hypothetical protein
LHCWQGFRNSIVLALAILKLIFLNSEGRFLPWIQVALGAPYFLTDGGHPWTPIEQNDAITWPDFAGLFRRKNIAAVEGHLA